MPNMYARGILFGKMVIELGDTCTVRNDAHNYNADLEFKTKGFFSGTYNAIAGRVRRGPTDLGDVSGKWSALMEFKPAKVRPVPSPPSPFPSSRGRCCLVRPYFYTPDIYLHLLDGREAHAVRRAEGRPRRRAQVGRARGRAGPEREPQAVARPDARDPSQGHGRRDGGQDGCRARAARAPRDGRQAHDALFRAAR